MSGITLTVKRTYSLVPEIQASIQAYEISAGVFRHAGKHRNSDELVAQVAAYNEFGTPTIPERAAFRSSFFHNRDKYLSMLVKIGRSMLKGQKVRSSRLEAMGEEAADDIRKSIVSGPWTANAESTQRKKGGGKQLINDPLVDTGQVLDSVDYEVIKK